MIKNFMITNHVGESIQLELGFPEKSGFLVREVTGLGPAKGIINTTELSVGEGSIYNSARLASRNIVLDLKFLGTPDIESTRQKSYRYFPIKKRIRFQIETDNRTLFTYGYVESNTPNIFSSSSGCQISIICPDPFFYANESGSDAVLSGIYSEFEFPFSNESLRGDLLSFGEIKIANETVIEYAGDSDVGINVRINAVGSATNPMVYNVLTNESMRIDTSKLETLTGSGIMDGDIITISTVKGNKYVSLLRDGVTYNILNCLDRDVDWLQLSIGTNVFAFVADSGSDSLHVSINYQVVYEGV